MCVLLLLLLMLMMMGFHADHGWYLLATAVAGEKESPRQPPAIAASSCGVSRSVAVLPIHTLRRDCLGVWRSTHTHANDVVQRKGVEMLCLVNLSQAYYDW